MLALLPACSNNAENVSIKHDLFIQLQASSDLLESLIATIAPLVNAAIKEELGLAKDDTFEFFLPKKRQALTVYFINDICEDGITQVLDLLATTDKNKLTLKDAQIALAPRIEFFGGQFDAKDELVIMIDDPQQKLSALNTTIKTAAHIADNVYKSVHSQSLYDISKSERYPYFPHIGLGRIRSTSIKEKSKTGVSFEKIQERILSDVKRVIGTLFADKNLSLQFKTIAVWDLQKRTVLKEYSVQSVFLDKNSTQNITLQKPTGQFDVGTTTLALADTSRKEEHNATANRELVAQVYYPIDKKKYSNETEKYLGKTVEYVKQNIADMKKITVDKLSYVNALKAHSIKDVAASDTSSNYPVIIFSPGFGAPQETYTSYLEELASHGYIVFGLNHPYVTNPTIFPDGRIILQDPAFNKSGSETKKDLEFKTWTSDIKFLIHELPTVNSTNNILRNKINLDQIGVMAHSFGGRVIIEAARQDTRIKAGVDLDGKLTSDTSLSGFDTPFMFIVAERKDTKDQNRLQQLQKTMTKDSYFIIIKGADHGTFTDLNLVFRPWLYQNNIDPAWGIEITRKYIVNFFDKYLKACSGPNFLDNFPDRLKI